jgi:hypothetical protein
MTAPLTDAELAQLDAETLLQRGVAAARAGDTEEARIYLRAATERDSLNPTAWIELAGVVERLEEKRFCFERALAADPANEPAQLGLAKVKQKMGITVAPPAPAGPEVLHCTWHPERETLVRCYRCTRPICPQCSVRGPVGLLCKECARANRPAIFDVKAGDYLVAGIVGLVLSTVAAFLVSFIGGFWFVMLFVAPPAGGLIADLMSRAVGMKRGRGMAVLAGACIVGGVLVCALGFAGLRLLFNVGIWFYVVLAVAGAYYRLR